MRPWSSRRRPPPTSFLRSRNLRLVKELVSIFSELFSGKQLKTTLRWILYALLFLIAELVQTVVLPRIPLGGIALSVVPTCIACVAVCEGAENATLYALLCGVFYCLAGTNLGPLYIVLFPACAAFSGAICDNYYSRSFLPALILSLLTLCVCGLVAFFFRVYLGSVSGAFWATVLVPEVLYSVLAVPPVYLGAWAISKIGR